MLELRKNLGNVAITHLDKYMSAAANVIRERLVKVIDFGLIAIVCSNVVYDGFEVEDWLDVSLLGEF